MSLAILLALPAPAPAACVAPAKCVTVPETQRTAPRFRPGDPFPVYDRSMILDPARHGLPPVDGPWRYYEDDGIIYRVGAADSRVIDTVTRR